LTFIRRGAHASIFQALRIVSEGFDVPTPMDVVVEVQQHSARAGTLHRDGRDRGMVRG